VSGAAVPEEHVPRERSLFASVVLGKLRMMLKMPLFIFDQRYSGMNVSLYDDWALFRQEVFGHG